MSKETGEDKTTNLLNPVRDFCSMEQRTIAISTSPAAARTLTVIDKFWLDIIQKIAGTTVGNFTLSCVNSANVFISRLKRPQVRQESRGCNYLYAIPFHDVYWDEQRLSKEYNRECTNITYLWPRLLGSSPYRVRVFRKVSHNNLTEFCQDKRKLLPISCKTLIESDAESGTYDQSSKNIVLVADWSSQWASARLDIITITHISTLSLLRN